MRVGFIYRIYCLDADVKECYIGSCWEIKKRMRVHKCNCTNKNSPKYNFKVYTFIRENGGWQNFDYEYFMVNVIDKTHLQMKEQKRMDIEINPILNSQRAYTNNLQYNKEYRINNKASINQYSKQYRIDNIETINKKYNCPCGGTYTRNHKARHLKSIKHQCYEIILHA